MSQYLAIMFALLSAQATSFVNRPMSEAVKDVPIIVRGTTGESYSDFEADKRRIFTYTHLVITEVLKGDIKETQILMRSPGGSKDGQEMSVPGAAQFTNGEDVVVMLGAMNTEDNSYDIPGLTTGKYNVARGENGETVLLNSLGSAAVYDPKKTAGTQAYNARVSLETFRRIAKGEDIPEAAHTQFEQSKAPPPPGAFEAGHNHDEILARGEKPKPHVPDADEVKQPEKTNVWVPLSFALIAAVAGLILWLGLRSSKDTG